jgi:hypothetical protein
MFRHNVIRAGGTPSSLAISRSAGRLSANAEAYARAWPITGLLIARDGEVRFEHYNFGRRPEMRMTSWSMAKSVTSLLFGIAWCGSRARKRSWAHRRAWAAGFPGRARDWDRC